MPMACAGMILASAEKDSILQSYANLFNHARLGRRRFEHKRRQRFVEKIE
jgi:hypothetical protein